MAYRCFTDGGKRNDCAGSGWVIFGAFCWTAVHGNVWSRLAEGSVFLGIQSVLYAECFAVIEVVHALSALVVHGKVMFNEEGRVCQLSESTMS